MTIAGVSGGSSPYTKKPVADESYNIVQLENQKKIMQEQLQKIKSRPKNTEAEQKSAEKQKENLERRIADIEKQIQKFSKGNLKNTIQNSKEITSVKLEKLTNNKGNDIEKTLDIYV